MTCRPCILLLMALVLSCLLKLFSMLPVLSILVVFLSFFRITQHFIGFIDLLKLFMGFFIIRVEVRVVFPCQLTVGFFNILCAGIFIQAKYLIIIYKFHGAVMIIK